MMTRGRLITLIGFKMGNTMPFGICFIAFMRKSKNNIQPEFWIIFLISALYDMIGKGETRLYNELNEN